VEFILFRRLVVEAQNRIDEMVKVLLKADALLYEPNVYPLEYFTGNRSKEKFFVSEREGHLTIDYSILAKALLAEGYCKASELFTDIYKLLRCNKAIHCGQKFYYERLEDDIMELEKKYESEIIK
jgi:hypothetical protein